MIPDKIELSPDGELLVYKKGYTESFVQETMRKRNLRGLRIFAVLEEDKLEDLDFLKNYPFLQALDITSGTDYHFDFLNFLTELRELSINVQGESKIDLGRLEKLESLSINWRRNIQGIGNCKKLNKIFLVEYKAVDLSVLSGLESLQQFSIKTGNLKRLDGLGGNKSLDEILLGNCRSLESIKEINGLQKLKTLRIERCTRIDDYENLTDLPALETLSLVDCKDIKSIRFIRQFPALRKLVLLGNTNIVDGDLLPAKDIKEVFHMHRSHYNIKIVNKNYQELIKKNLGR
jgi:hypothetical protein